VNATWRRLNMMMKSQVFVSFIISYVIIISVIILITSGMYVFILNEMIDEISHNCDRAFMEVANDIDTIIKSYRRLVIGLSMQDKIQILTINKHSLDLKQRQLIIDVYNLLRKTCSDDPSIECVYMYMPWNESVISSYGFSGIDEFYSNYYVNIFDTQSDWLDMLIPRDDYSVTIQKGKLLFVAKVPIGSLNVYNGSLVLQIDSSRVLSCFDIIYESFNAQSAITDSSKVLLAWSNQKDVFEEIIQKDRNGRYNINNKNIIFKSRPSIVNEWKYVTFIFEDDLFSKTKVIGKIMLTSCLICLILGISLALLFSNKNYRPIQSLIGLIKPTEVESKIQKVNEYNYVEKFIRTVIKEKDLLSEQLSQYYKEVQYEYIRRLMIGCQSEVFDDNPYIKNLNIYFKDAWSVILLVSGIENIKLAETVSFINNNIKLQNSEIISFIINDLIAVIICYRNNDPDQGDIHRTIETIYENIIVFTGGNICMGCSEKYRDTSSLPVMYEEAHRVLEYKQLLYGEGIGFISDLPVNDDCGNISFNDHIKLQNALKADDFSEALKIFDEIIIRYFPETGVSTQMIKCRMFSLINTIIVSLQNADIKGIDDFWENIKPTERLLNCNTVHELVNEARTIFKELDQMIKGNHDMQKNRKISDVNKYLLEKYKDPNLSVSLIAEHFNIHPTALSRQFKQFNKINLLDRIHQLRISEAKRLLKESDLSITEISRLVGYNNDITFLRVFKRFEGITPSQYRNIET